MAKMCSFHKRLELQARTLCLIAAAVLFLINLFLMSRLKLRFALGSKSGLLVRSAQWKSQSDGGLTALDTGNGVSHTIRNGTKAAQQQQFWDFSRRSSGNCSRGVLCPAINAQPGHSPKTEALLAKKQGSLAPEQFVEKEASRKMWNSSYYLTTVCMKDVNRARGFVFKGETSVEGRSHRAPIHLVYFYRYLWPSSLVRGLGMMNFLNAHPQYSITAENVHTEKGLQWKQKPDVCVMWKFFVPAVIKKCKDAGIPVLFDIIEAKDMYNAAQKVLTAPSQAARQSAVSTLRQFSGVIFINCQYASMVAEAAILARINTQVSVIPHHHTNVRGYSYAEQFERVELLIIGASEHNPVDSDIKFLREGLSRMNTTLRLQSSPPAALQSRRKTYVATHCSGLAGDEKTSCEQVAHHFDFEGAFAGLIWVRDMKDEFEKHYRPNTRLVTAWSHGLPTAFYVTSAYRVVCQSLLDTEMFKGQDLESVIRAVGGARDLSEVLSFVQRIQADTSFRKQLSVTVQAVSQQYTQSSIAALYRNAICGMMGPRIPNCL
mmetsp:Transcript_44209/g.69130  ORF Transcript_44209/g.69130 Transcript_44209/m.69130 type:complete len:546 (-) Transcript_44209:1030-2667(-)